MQKTGLKIFALSYYTLSQSKQNFLEVAFLLEKSVYICTSESGVTDPGAPGKMDRLKLRFF